LFGRIVEDILQAGKRLNDFSMSQLGQFSGSKQPISLSRFESLIVFEISAEDEV
jgi:hypothetical protein